MKADDRYSSGLRLRAGGQWKYSHRKSAKSKKFAPPHSITWSASDRDPALFRFVRLTRRSL
jgi:hypothetical protein